MLDSVTILLGSSLKSQLACLQNRLDERAGLSVLEFSGLSLFNTRESEAKYFEYLFVFYECHPGC